MTPDEEIAHLWAENTRQREQIAALMARARVLEGRLNRLRWMLRWALMLGVLAVLLATGIGLLVARNQGAFESRLTYWRERGQNCGDIQVGLNRVVVDQSEAVQAVACFTAAHTKCKAATLTRIEGGIDTSESDTFVVEPWNGGGGCDVGLLSIGSGITGTSTREVQCASVTSADDGQLTISGCRGFGDITLPDSQPHPVLP